MTVAISLLRAINVGGNNLIRMEALRTAHEALGLADVQTYVQSGNVVFRTKLRDVAGLGRRIEDSIEQSHGFRPGVIVRTADEMRDAIARNPFEGRKGMEPAKLQVVFRPRRTRGVPPERPRALHLLPRRHGTVEIPRANLQNTEDRGHKPKLEHRYEARGDGGGVGKINARAKAQRR